MRPENRCIEYVSDRETKRYRKCSKCYYRIISTKKLCWAHYTKQCRIYIVDIQKIYRGYKCRKIMKNIFIRLPIDIQHKIINYNRADMYYKNHCKTLHNIIYKRYTICHALQLIPYNTSTVSSIFGNVEIISGLDIIKNTYYLYNKYFDLIYCKFSLNMVYELQYLGLTSSYLISRLKNISQTYFYEISDNPQGPDMIAFSETYKRLNECLSYVSNFKIQYADYLHFVECYKS